MEQRYTQIERCKWRGKNLKSKIQEWVEQEIENLYQEAKSLVESYRSLQEGEKGTLGVTARRTQTSIQIVWYKRRFANKRNGERVLNSKHLSKGSRAPMYPKSAFSKIEAWEKAAVNEFEPQFAAIRGQVAQLMNIKNSVRTLDKYEVEMQLPEAERTILRPLYHENELDEEVT
jgi:prefoldin subunit 5